MKDDDFCLKDKEFLVGKQMNVIPVKDVEEFLRRENRLIDLLFKNVISIPEFWIKRNKLMGKFE